MKDMDAFSLGCAATHQYPSHVGCQRLAVPGHTHLGHLPSKIPTAWHGLLSIWSRTRISVDRISECLIQPTTIAISCLCHGRGLRHWLRHEDMRLAAALFASLTSSPQLFAGSKPRLPPHHFFLLFLIFLSSKTVQRACIIQGGRTTARSLFICLYSWRRIFTIYTLVLLEVPMHRPFLFWRTGSQHSGVYTIPTKHS